MLKIKLKFNPRFSVLVVYSVANEHQTLLMNKKPEVLRTRSGNFIKALLNCYCDFFNFIRCDLSVLVCAFIQK